MKLKPEKGFTLIELLIVIGIIAILAAAVIIAINPGQQFEQARNSTRRSDMNSIANAVYSYTVANQGQYPSCVGSSFVSVSNCSTDLVDGGYISELPTDPSGADYEISLTSTGDAIELKSTASEWDTANNVVQ